MTLSNRVAPIALANRDIVDGYFVCAQNPYHPITNPQGYINFGTAENHLLWDLLETKTRRAPPLSEQDSHYQALHGKLDIRTSIARLLERRAARKVSPDHVIVAAGATAVVEMLAFSLCDAGDALLVPAPYYPGFDHASQLRAAVEILPLQSHAEQSFSWTLDQLRGALDTHPERKRIRALLINSPHNPLGAAYPRATLDALVELTASEGLHLVVDEMYGESHFPGADVPSALTYQAPHVHTVYGFSKDFGLSGLGVGVLHSHDEALLRTVQTLTHFCRVSNQTQALLQYLLDDVAWRDALLHENRHRLAKSYKTLTQRLQSAGIPYMEAVGGIFVFLNLSQFLSEHSFGAEQRLTRDILDHCRVNLSPGSLFHCAEPGWFRLCYATHEEVLVTGLDRLLHWLRSRSR
jgi:aspartate/methionine/tyrosine aminotransferase